MTKSNSERVTNLTDAKGIELFFEKANLAAETAEKGKGLYVLGVVTAGNELLAAKAAIPHGEWSHWLKQHWNYSQQTASEYMRAANYGRARNLEHVTSLRELMQVMAEDPEVATRTRITGQVTVVDPEESSTPVGEEPAEEHEADTPSIDPPTNRKTSQDSRKVSESKKPKTQPIAVTAELVDEPAELPTVVRVDDPDALINACCRVCRPTQILRVLVSACSPESAAELGKLLRKAADTVDPPEEDKIPTAAQCVSEIPDDFDSDLRDTAEEWARYKQSRPRGDKIQSLRAWRIALKAFRKYPKHVVISKVEKAIASSWKGWEQNDQKNGKSSDELYRNPGPRAPVKYDNVPN